ncbi:MAG: stage V sporulation protein B [Clostridium sp.]|uniref:stage V sporulation protein B n=1 Tax=Clostridium sp. TaxID=1506 RepID=UPI002FC918FF
MEGASFFKKTIVLTASNILTGTLTFVYTIFLSRQMGPSGMGLYQLITPVFAMFLCITGGGITVTMSKIAAEKKAKGNLNELYKTVRIMCMFEIIWSLIVGFFLILLSRFISGTILSEPRTLYGIIAFCPAIIIISLSSVFKGTYYGLQRILEPAIIDIVEKILRIAMIFPLMTFVKNLNLSVEYYAASAMLVISLGEVFSFILFLLSYKRYKKRHPSMCKTLPSKTLMTNVLRLAIPLALNGILSTIFSMILTILIPKRLVVSGLTHNEAIALLGKLEGMALTIIFYPSVILNALCTVLIPSISEAVASGKDYIINHKTNIAIKVASVVGFSSTVLILSHGASLGEFFYKDAYIGYILSLIALPLPLVYIQSISFSILNGLGKQGRLFINSTITSVSDLIIIYLLLAIPSFGIQGYAINFFLSSLLAVILNFSVINKSFKFKLDFVQCILIPAICSLSQYIFGSLLFNSDTYTPILIVGYYLLFFLFYIPLYLVTYKKIKLHNIKKAS